GGPARRAHATSPRLRACTGWESAESRHHLDGVMPRRALRRLVLIIPTLLGVASLVFAFLHLVPGDPVEIMLGESAAPADVAALRHDLGLDRPLPAQYARFLARAARGDLGQSIAFRAPVAEVIADRYPATLELAGTAFLLALALAVPPGVVAAARDGSMLDRLTRLGSLAGVCLPSLWLGPPLIRALSTGPGWPPGAGPGRPPRPAP